ncbi:lipid A deacylase LpxR family protein [Dinghuibacter silviterrae]|uniref:Lipid A deacylase LpxR family protein n=1 Tax=Dinghuibacter silviterrae TaxID=1539049 RepID=A0A4R8DRP6_9BACT|nr:lipid A deacylase LpxR family protein [Dinghuibacter silviterrae]TDX00890.1 hypothetical protein EDB95_1919 [Dinghuibacter silviterrae]
MKPLLLALTISALFIGINNGKAQAPTHIFGVYWDDDFLNVQGKGTDNSYTSGERLEYFYTKNHPSRFFADRLMPKAGRHSTDIYGWSLMQVMYTPDNLLDPNFQPNDYPWSGAVFATHSLYSYNARRAFAYKTELTLGMMGPVSLAGPSQTMVHRTVHYKEPKGWSNQYGNAPLLNVSFAAEKKEWGWSDAVDIIGGTRVDAGTMLDGLTAYEILRVGKLDPYFNGFLNLTGRRSKGQFYFFLQPTGEAVAYNAILQGGLTSWKPSRVTTYGENGKMTETTASYHPISNFLFEGDFGWVVSLGNVTLTYTQKPSTAYMKGLYSHNVGNITLYIAW